MDAIGAIYFYACAALALAGALGVVLSKNPIRAAMGLLLLILSIAGLFLALHAQFLAAVQLIVYAGAIVILFIFVIMLLGPSATSPDDRRGFFVRAFSGTLFGIAGIGAVTLVGRVLAAGPAPAPLTLPDSTFGGIDAFGSVLFSDALAPFELSSALLMVAVVGAIAVARGRQGVRTLSRSESAAAASAGVESLSSALPGNHPTGVFGHEIHLTEAPSPGTHHPSGVEHRAGIKGAAE
jgi:NADH-quinone oxidoreductase subunit J